MSINEQNANKYKKVWLYTAFGFNQSDIETITGITRKTIAKWQKEFDEFLTQKDFTSLKFNWEYPFLPFAYAFPNLLTQGVAGFHNLTNTKTLNLFRNDLNRGGLFMYPVNFSDFERQRNQYLCEPLFIALQLYKYNQSTENLVLRDKKSDLQIKKLLLNTVKSLYQDKPKTDSLNKLELLLEQLFKLESSISSLFMTFHCSLLYCFNKTEFTKKMFKGKEKTEQEIKDLLNMTMSKATFEDYLNELCDLSWHVLELTKQFFKIPDITFNLSFTKDKQGITDFTVNKMAVTLRSIQQLKTPIEKSSYYVWSYILQALVMRFSNALSVITYYNKYYQELPAFIWNAERTFINLNMFYLEDSKTNAVKNMPVTQQTTSTNVTVTERKVKGYKAVSYPTNQVVKTILSLPDSVAIADTVNPDRKTVELQTPNGQRVEFTFSKQGKATDEILQGLHAGDFTPLEKYISSLFSTRNSNIRNLPFYFAELLALIRNTLETYPKNTKGDFIINNKFQVVIDYKRYRQEHNLAHQNLDRDLDKRLDSYNILAHTGMQMPDDSRINNTGYASLITEFEPPTEKNHYKIFINISDAFLEMFTKKQALRFLPDSLNGNEDPYVITLFLYVTFVRHQTTGDTGSRGRKNRIETLLQWLPIKKVLNEETQIYTIDTDYYYHIGFRKLVQMFEKKMKQAFGRQEDIWYYCNEQGYRINPASVNDVDLTTFLNGQVWINHSKAIAQILENKFNKALRNETVRKKRLSPR